MSVIVEFTVAGEDFLMGDVLRTVPDVVVEIERVVAHADERVTPYFWVSGDGDEALDAAIEADPSVEDVVVVDDFGCARLLRAEWQDGMCDVVHAFRSIEMVLLEATGREGTWKLRLRFNDRGALDAMNDFRREHGIQASIDRIYHPDEPNAGGQFGLTPTQHDTLVAALEAGYYDLPRGVTHEELAERMGVSQQSISNRLHRAHGNLVRSALTVGDVDHQTPPPT